MRMTREEILSSLDTALAEKQFVIYIQPQFNHATKQLVGGEALVRWIHPEHGMQSPVDFIPVFEDSGLQNRPMSRESMNLLVFCIGI